MRTICMLMLAACAGEPGGIAESPTALLAVDDQLFWRTEDGALVAASPDSTRVRVVGDPGKPQACSASLPNAASLQPTSAGIYWLACDATLWRAARDGSHSESLGITSNSATGF